MSKIPKEKSLPSLDFLNKKKELSELISDLNTQPKQMTLVRREWKNTPSPTRTNSSSRAKKSNSKKNKKHQRSDSVIKSPENVNIEPVRIHPESIENTSMP